MDIRYKSELLGSREGWSCAPVCNKVLLLQTVTGNTKLVVASIQCHGRQLSYVWKIGQGPGSKSHSVACVLGRYFGPPSCKRVCSKSKPGKVHFGPQSLACSAATPPVKSAAGAVLAAPGVFRPTTLPPEPTNHS